MANKTTKAARAADQTEQGPTSDTAVDAAPRKPRRLKAVPERSAAQIKWEAADRARRAKARGMTVEELEEVEDLSEDWKQDLAVEREPAGEEYAGVYHLKNGHLGVPRLSPTPIRAGRKVRLNADEGRCASESGVGIRIGD